MSRRILVRGPALTNSDYGTYCREVLRSLRSNKENDVYLLNIGWQNSGWISTDDEERAWIDDSIRKTASSIQSGDTNFPISIQVQTPLEWKRLAKYNIGITLGTETEKNPDTWSEPSMQMDHIVVPSSHAKQAFGETISENITVVGIPATIQKSRSKSQVKLSEKFNFLVDTKWNPGSNLEQVISSFVQEFENEEVGLLLKTNVVNGSVIDRHHVAEHLDSILSVISPERKCSVYLLHGNMEEKEINSLYLNKAVGAYISAQHSAKYNFATHRAASLAVPIIAPHWGSTEEYPVNFLTTVEYEMSKLEERHVQNADQVDEKWCSPNTGSLRSRMREVYNNVAKYKKQSKSLQSHIKENFTEQTVNMGYNNIIENILQTKNKEEENEIE